MKILSTKILPIKIIDYAISSRVFIDCIDLLKIVPISFDFNESCFNKYDAVVFTSSNAVSIFFSKYNYEIPSNIKVFATNQNTEFLLKKFNIKVCSSSKNSAQISRLIIKKKCKNVLHICGNSRLDTLNKQLSAKSINYECLVVYKTYLINKTVNTYNYDGIMFYSPSGVISFFQNNCIKKKLLISTIGKTTYDELIKNDLKDSEILVSKIPSVIKMVDDIKIKIK